MKRRLYNTYLLRGGLAEITYESAYKLGSKNNYADLRVKGIRRYGKYFEIYDYEEYKTYVKRNKIINVTGLY